MFKNYITKLEKCLFVFVVILSNLLCGSNTNIEAQTDKITEDSLNLYGRAAILIDADTGRALYEKNADEKLPMASTTKIMTCILAIEYGNEEDIVTFSDYAASMPQVKLGAKSGDQYMLKDLLYSLMLESHNDTAVAIAEHIAGSTEEFAKLMNEKAKEIGALNTNFVTPNGLDDDNHYTTARDLALIARYAISNEKFVEIISTESHILTEANGKGNTICNNKDLFLNQMDGAFGIKTGFTGNAGYCFVGALKDNGRTFISVTLGAGWPPNKTYKWSDTKNLMNYGIENYSYKEIYDGSYNFPKQVPIKNGIKDYIYIENQDNLSALVRDDEEVSVKLILTKELEAPIKKGDNVGYVIISVNDEEIAKYEVKSWESVEKFNILYCIKKIMLQFVL